jgi:glycosyltransferase involved in cell wall biosynthesis
MKIDLIYPLLPPHLDGIGDYTALIAAELAKQHTVRILTGLQPTVSPIQGVEILPVFDLSDHTSMYRLTDCVKSIQPDWVILQYNPFGYGRRGFNLVLPRVMSRMRSQFPSIRLAMMAHEMYVELSSVKFAVMTTWQRWQFWRLIQAMDVAFFSMESRLNAFKKWFSQKRIVHLQVGSNIPRVQIDSSAARERLGIDPNEIVLGIFGQSHVSRSFELARSAAEEAKRRGFEIVILYLGPDGEEIRTHFPNTRMITDGPHPPAEVSKRLAAIDVFLATYTDGVSTRRGAFLAALEHGLAIAGTVTEQTGHLLNSHNSTAYFLCSPLDHAGFVANVIQLIERPSMRTLLSKEASSLFERHFTWPHIAEKMLKELCASDCITLRN